MTRVSPRRPSRRATRRGVVVSVAGALALAAALVWQSAYAGFTDSTTSLPVTVSSGTVNLTNNVEGYSTITLDDLRPGKGATQCVIVTSTGTEPAVVKLYGRNRTAAGLTSYVNFVWASGTGGGANGDCTGFVASGSPQSVSMASFPTSYGSGYQTWTTAGGSAPETRTYRLSYSLADNPPTSIKGTSASITFVWEAQQQP